MRVAVAVACLVLCACSNVPESTLGDNGRSEGNEPVPQTTLDSPTQLSPEDAEEYTRLVREARGAFLMDPRTIEGVQDSHDLFKKALKLKATEYDTLWQAARTAIWLSNYADENQKQYCLDGITYANTALKIKPKGEEALFYDGTLAGKLAELDIMYGADGLKTIESRMRELIELGSTYVYGGPHRVLGILLMRSPGPPLGPGDWDEAEKMMLKAVEIEPNWPENQLYMAELEFGLANERDDEGYAKSARERLNKHFLSEDSKPPMGSEFEFREWQKDARKLVDDSE